MSPEAAVAADDVEPLFAIEHDLRAGTNAPHARLCFPYPHIGESPAAGPLARLRKPKQL
jgi:hypothetical protein